MTLSTETTKSASKSTKKPAAKKLSIETPSTLAKKKGITAKAVRAFLRRHFDVKKNAEGLWVITDKMVTAVMEA
jgi:transposase